MSARKLFVQTAAEVERQLEGRPALFLSASIPYRRVVPKRLKRTDRKDFIRTNNRYLEAARPVQVRSAVVALTRSMLMRGMRLVFGAHPAISPIVLSVARDLQPEGAEPRIIIFQSQYFERVLPTATLELANWEAGLLVFTPVVRVEGQSSEDWRAPSLKLMRRLMLSVPNLQAAIFIGGMEGVLEEAKVFSELNPGKPVIPVASTGSAAEELWEKSRKLEAAPGIATKSLFEHLRYNPSYSLVAEEILGQLGIE